MSDPTHPFQIRDYRLFWLARFASVMATTGIVVVLGWQVYDLARSAYGMSPSAAAFQLGVIGLVQFVPLFVLAPFAGLVADRYDRRKVGAFAIAVDFTMAFLLAFCTTRGILTLPLLFGLAAMHGVSRAFFGPALGAIAPNIVPAALIPKAIGLNSMAMQIGTVAGPALGGLLYAWSASLPYWISAGLLGIASVAMLAIRPFAMPKLQPDIHPLRRIAEGFRFVRNEHLLLGCMTLDLFAVLFAGATALLPVYARDILTWDGIHYVGSQGLGLLRAAPAVGAAVMALFLSVRPIETNVGTKMLWAVVVFGAATALFGVSSNFVLSLVLLVVLGAADMISMFVRALNSGLKPTPSSMKGERRPAMRTVPASAR